MKAHFSHLLLDRIAFTERMDCRKTEWKLLGDDGNEGWQRTTDSGANCAGRRASDDLSRTEAKMFTVLSSFPVR